MNNPRLRSILEACIVIMLILPCIIALYTYPLAPERVPIHWNFQGEADNWADKSVGLFLMPLLNIVLYFFLKYLPKIDPNKEKIEQSQGLLTGIRLAVHTFLAVIVGWTNFSIIGIVSISNTIMLILIASLMSVMGKIMVSVKQNYFFGIRTPWTLASEEVWMQTHRLGGNLWFYSGLLLIVILGILGFINVANEVIMTLFFTWIGFIIGVPLVYSYVLFRKLKKNSQ